MKYEGPKSCQTKDMATVKVFADKQTDKMDQQINGRGMKIIGLDWDSTPGPHDYVSCTLPLCYQTTCRLASGCVTMTVSMKDLTSLS